MDTARIPKYTISSEDIAALQQKKKDLRFDYSDTQNKLKLSKLLLTWPTFKKFKVNP